jgi:hypothetical protein
MYKQSGREGVTRIGLQKAALSATQLLSELKEVRTSVVHPP